MLPYLARNKTLKNKNLLHPIQSMCNFVLLQGHICYDSEDYRVMDRPTEGPTDVRTYGWADPRTLLIFEYPSILKGSSLMVAHL